jgi:hypothetical protein
MTSLCRSPLVGASLALAVMLTAGSGATAATGDHARLKHQIPHPGQRTPKALTELVGTTSDGRFAVAVVRNARRETLAYVCDGRGIGRWLTGDTSGGRLRLHDPHGSRLVARLTAGRATGTLRIAGKTRSFVLVRASRDAGVRHLVIHGADAGWVVTNGGRIVGVATKAGKPVASVDAGPGDDSAGETGETGTGLIGNGGNGISPQDKASTCDSLQKKADAIREMIKAIRDTGVLSVAQEERIGFLTASIVLIDRQLDRLGCF